MDIHRVTYSSGVGAGVVAAGDQLLYTLGDLEFVCNVLSVGNGFPTAGTFVISIPVGELPYSGGTLTKFPTFDWQATVSSYQLLTPKNIVLRNPGAKFNIKLQDVVAALIGAYWGVKVTVQ